jgi:hypothetical protein
MREVRNVDTSHGGNRPIIEYIPESDEDVLALKQMWAKGEIGVGRDEKDYYHVKVAPGTWLWIGPREQVDAGYADLISAFKALRTDGVELIPGIFLLPRFFGEVIGKDGVETLAEQGRLLLGDEDFLAILSDAARNLVVTLATLDIPEAMGEEDKSAPGQGEASA